MPPSKHPMWLTAEVADGKPIQESFRMNTLHSSPNFPNNASMKYAYCRMSCWCSETSYSWPAPESRPGSGLSPVCIGALCSICDAWLPMMLMQPAPSEVKHPVAFSGDSKNRLWLFYLSHIWAFAVVAYVASPTTPAAAATASANGSNSIMLTMLKLFVCVAYRPSVGHPSRHFPRACSYDGSSRKATSALLDPATTTAEAAAPNPNRPD